MKNNVYPCKAQFLYIKGSLRGSKLYRYAFVMAGMQRGSDKNIVLSVSALFSYDIRVLFSYYNYFLIYPHILLKAFVYRVFCQ